MAGTKLKKTSDDKVFFENLLMTPGKKIMDWSSRLNYQVFKEVPSLPILQNGKKYQIKLSLSAKPVNTVIFCLRFFDLQMSEISNIVFSSLEKTFTYPQNAVSYTFEILNGGCSEIEFSKFQIGNAALSENCFEDLYLMPLNKNELASKLVLILVADSKRSREIEQIKLDSNIEGQFYLVYTSWQKRNQLESSLKQWLKSHPYDESFIFTNKASLNQKIDNLSRDNKNVKIIDMGDEFSLKDKKAQWFVPSAIQINQNQLVKDALKYFKG